MSSCKVEWKFTLLDGEHTVEFHHGTISGKRVIILDGKEILRQNWVFKLVGQEEFIFGSGDDKHTGVITIDTDSINYRYTMYIDGTPLNVFVEERRRTTKSWHAKCNKTAYYVVLDIETLEVYVNGSLMSTTGEFVEDGTETHFQLDKEPVYILTEKGAGNKVTHSLFVYDEEVSADNEDRHSGVAWTGAKA